MLTHEGAAVAATPYGVVGRLDGVRRSIRYLQLHVQTERSMVTSNTALPVCYDAHLTIDGLYHDLQLNMKFLGA